MRGHHNCPPTSSHISWKEYKKKRENEIKHSQQGQLTIDIGDKLVGMDSLNSQFVHVPAGATVAAMQVVAGQKSVVIYWSKTP